MLESRVKRRCTDHLTPEERGLIFASWQINRAVKAVAKDINCSERIVQKHYRDFNLEHRPFVLKDRLTEVRHVALSVSTSTQNAYSHGITLARCVVEPEFQLRSVL